MLVQNCSMYAIQLNIFHCLIIITTTKIVFLFFLGEDRWLCTLLMQRGWRLAYSAHAHNSTHCPETVGEFLRQRRRWVLSELSNMAAIFLSLPTLVRNNASFSGVFLVSLVTTLLWVVLSPSTTLVFLCAGLHLLYTLPMMTSLPAAAALLVGYSVVCCVCNPRKQKMASVALTFLLAAIVVTLGVGFIAYVVKTINFGKCLMVYLFHSFYFLFSRSVHKMS